MSEWNDTDGPGPADGPIERSANRGDPANRPGEFDPAERRQRNALIGLAVASAIVLLIGSVAFLASRSGGSTDATLGSVPTSTTTAATLPETTTTASTTTVSATTTLPSPVEVVADAGPDLAVDAGAVVTLQAVAVTDDAADDEVTWRQLSGPDVTAGVGALGGRAVSFGAPDDVVTLRFELVVSSSSRAATAPEAVDTITVRVFEQADAAIFVDAQRGDDAGDGSMESPVRSLVEASRRTSGGADIYARSSGTYDESEPIRLGAGSSLYGGFDEDWNRDRAARIEVNGSAVGIIVDGDGDRRISAIELTGADAGAGQRAIGVRVSDGETVVIEDSRIVSGRAGDGLGTDGDGLAGASVGVLAIDTGEIRLERSTVNGGSGGDGATPASGDDRSNGESGEDSEGVRAGAGGQAGGEGRRPGGDGADGSTNGPGNDAPGDAGGSGGAERGDDGEPGDGGAGGDGGFGGNGGVGLFDSNDAVPIGASGSIGNAGDGGFGAGGGGGGASGPDVGDEDDNEDGVGDEDGVADGDKDGAVSDAPGVAAGGAGGGGGAGGRGSDGGAAGGGGGGSIGVWAVRVNRVVIVESLVAAGRGGDGAAGAPAGAAGDGGRGGSGVGAGGAGGEGDGVAASSGAGSGAGGGGGGAGGVGGAGGGGAGGPSYGMLTSDVDAVEIMATTIRGGGGGTGSNGGVGGAAGAGGDAGSGRTGGAGGIAGGGDPADTGRGASGGSSFGWFDVDDATQTFQDADFIEGVAGSGGRGSTSGETGLEADANVDAG